MIPTLLATSIKLRRPVLLGGTYAATALVTVLVTALTFVLADADPSDPGAPPGLTTTTAGLSGASGLLSGLSSSTGLFGIIALCVAAATFASEYTTGTLRNLLIRRPQRVRLLGGIWAAVVVFTVGSVLVAALAAGATALVLADGQGVTTTAWFTSDGLTSSLRTIADVALAAAGYATLGAALGLLLRAPVPAVAIGIGWLFVVETIIAGTVDGASRWLPGQLLSAVASNGTADVTFGAAVVTLGAYLLATSGAATASFVRRDVVA